MTWILGSAVVLGYGALVSDVRAVWPDGQHLDALQKIYPVGDWMMAGFAGSVEFGFATIKDLQRCHASPPPGQMWAPQIAAWRWRRRARNAFAKAPSDIQKLGCSILLVGVSPFIKGGFPQTRCIRMRSPDFVPEFAKPFAWLSIGSGATRDIAQEYAGHSLSEFSKYAQGETMNPGGTATTMAMFVAMALAKHPVAKISSRLQVGTVWLNRYDLKTLETEQYGPAWSSWHLADPKGVATSWSEFQQLATVNGLRASAAAT